MVSAITLNGGDNVVGIAVRVALMVSIFAAFSARAQEGCRIGRAVRYTQTSAAAPTAADWWITFAIVEFGTPISTATVSFDRPPRVSLDLADLSSNFFYYESPQYATAAEMLMGFPPTLYTVEARSGAARISGDILLPADLFSVEVPHLTGTTFGRIQAYDSTTEFRGSVNSLVSPAQVASIYLNIRDEHGHTIWSRNATPSETDFSLWPGLLEPGASYDLWIIFIGQTTTPGGFGGYPMVLEFNRGTIIPFTTLGTLCVCAGDMNCDGVIDFADYLEFLNSYDAGEVGADLTRDGVVDFADYLAFLNHYDAGC